MRADLLLAVGKALSIIKASGLPDFGAYPKGDEALAEFVKVYTIALAEEPNITPIIVEETALRYIRGHVQTTTENGMAPVSRFPSSADFYRECKRTYTSCYRTVEIGTYEDKQGRVIAKTITVPASMHPADVVKAIGKAKRELNQGSEFVELPEHTGVPA